ncbi:DUF2231 domain-containing protein [Lentzea sp. NBRC 102530]|uniref:DUF2231 domain-containing protein n=1 Tax=Lentzea sp. NBRC 102530 TaxID=3032201 RepID=UPI00249FD3F8|nr:DUF2231 domain-containing protein [Lentzea sp. NBRC 102530]GLY51425.1 hypothetical protein Lesp01_50810 [Lentzea sp. NBRC 102530]
MRSRVRAAGHAVHPILIVFPLGLLTTAVGFDVLYLVTERGSFAFTSAHLIAAGLLMGVVTAATGWLDWWLVVPRGTRARRIGLLHGVVNAAVLVVFAVSWALRLGAPDWGPTWPAVIAGWLGLLAGGLGGWLGGELVERLGVSVEEDAHVDAPSSLSGATSAR